MDDFDRLHDEYDRRGEQDEDFTDEDFEYLEGIDETEKKEEDTLEDEVLVETEFDF